ncbi:ribonuclease III [Malassezia psittaci]|uniref:Ribonuclease III n=1 Tax=Malassezia psittaci TaxID=1821823 RepID=A0AAF0JEJ5_9BASI|nr:ribonuclease III [Malassezia psittaci]
MTYMDMAKDLARFFEEHQLSKHALVGHSLGGKAVMALALSDLLPDNTLSHLVVVDIAPAEGSISPEFMKYTRTMLEIEKANLQSRNEADKFLAKVEPNLSIRQFLLTNLTRTDDGLRFRNPVETLLNALDGIGQFPYKPQNDGQPAEKHWNGPTLFIKGKNSNYINQNNLPSCRSFFPNMALKELSTGHWVQSEAPREFLRTVREFLE